MTAQNHTMLNTVLAMPEIERVEFVQALLDSFAPDDELEDQMFAQELERRLEDSRNNPQASLPWSEVKQMR